jgi:amino acid transporter
VLNIYGVRLVSIINNTGVVFEILGMFVFALILMAFHNHQGFSVVTKSAGFHVNGSTFLAAMFMSLFVIYGFDTASTLAEETKDPRRQAPKAVLFSVIGAFVIGGVFLLGTLVAIPDLGAAVKGSFGPAAIIEANFSTPFATIYLLVVAAAIFVCCLSIMASTIRLCFGMARDNQLPGSKFLARVSPGLHTPIWSCIAVACIAAIPFWQYSGAGIIAIAATGMIYLSYFLGNIVIMRARMNGWPRLSAPFKLGRWGALVNIVALIYGGAMLVNFAWPRAASNPEPKQTGGLLHLNFLDGVPILWTVVIFIALIGAVYYLAVGRRKTFPPVVAPSEDDDAPLAV